MCHRSCLFCCWQLFVYLIYCFSILTANCRLEISQCREVCRSIADTQFCCQGAFLFFCNLLTGLLLLGTNTIFKRVSRKFRNISRDSQFPHASREASQSCCLYFKHAPKIRATDFLLHIWSLLATPNQHFVKILIKKLFYICLTVFLKRIYQ